MINVVNWFVVCCYVWDILLKVCVMENFCYVVGVNCIGVDGNDVVYSGGIVVYDFKGDILVVFEDN